ncbi:MAG: hypothetical protein ACKVG0_01325 [Alphaproteobacteria bacterium]
MHDKFAVLGEFQDLIVIDGIGRPGRTRIAEDPDEAFMVDIGIMFRFRPLIVWAGSAPATDIVSLGIENLDRRPVDFIAVGR